MTIMPNEIEKRPVYTTIMHVNGDIHVDYHASIRAARRAYHLNVEEMKEHAESHGLSIRIGPCYCSLGDGSADVGIYA